MLVTILAHDASWPGRARGWTCHSLLVSCKVWKAPRGLNWNALKSRHRAFACTFPSSIQIIYLSTLLEGVFGSKRWMAARFGALGDRSKREAKAAASRKNGKLGVGLRKVPSIRNVQEA